MKLYIKTEKYCDKRPAMDCEACREETRRVADDYFVSPSMAPEKLRWIIAQCQERERQYIEWPEPEIKFFGYDHAETCRECMARPPEQGRRICLGSICPDKTPPT
jgi:hypothetical protein